MNEAIILARLVIGLLITAIPISALRALARLRVKSVEFKAILSKEHLDLLETGISSIRVCTVKQADLSVVPKKLAPNNKLLCAL